MASLALCKRKNVDIGASYTFRWDDGGVGYYTVISTGINRYNVVWANGCAYEVSFGCPINLNSTLITDFEMNAHRKDRAGPSYCNDGRMHWNGLCVGDTVKATFMVGSISVTLTGTVLHLLYDEDDKCIIRIPTGVATVTCKSCTILDPID